MLFSLLIGIEYATLDEIHQLFVDGRSGQFIDVCIDTIGVALGICIWMLCYKVVIKIVNKQKGRRFRINKKVFLGILLLLWFVIVYLFSSQTGRESSKMSDKVTRELLKIKDTLSVVIERHKEANEILVKRNTDQSHHQRKS